MEVQESLQLHINTRTTHYYFTHRLTSYRGYKWYYLRNKVHANWIKDLRNLEIVNKGFYDKSGFIKNTAFGERKNIHESEIGASSIIDIVIQEHYYTPKDINKNGKE